MIKAIIFDFGGPIVEWKENMAMVYRKHEDHRSFQRDTLSKLFKQYVAGGNIGDFHTIDDFYDKTKPSIDITVEELNEIFNEANAAMRVRPEMIDYIAELKKKYKIALLSNFTNGLEKLLRELFDIYHLFDVIISSYDLKIKKPDPYIYEHVLKKLGVKPEEAVYIDDLEENVKGAEAMGIKGLLFGNAVQCKTDLDKMLL